MRTFLISIILFAALQSSLCAETPRFRWDIVDHAKRDNVTAKSVKTFYRFKSMKRVGGNLVLERPSTKITFKVGSSQVWMNGVKFIFSHPVVQKENQYLISMVDLHKVIHPILRPDRLTKYANFTKVILDPGHGGKDSGAKNAIGREKDITLKVARMMRDNLKRRGFQVILTRNSDKYLSLEERVRIANQHQGAIFISLHFNSGGRGQAHGIETFSLSPKGVAHYGRGLKNSDFTNRTGNAQDAANIALATAIHGTVLDGTKRLDRGVRRARFSVLTGVKHPAILLEGGFLSHGQEGRLITSTRYQRLLADSVVNAIVKYRKALRLSRVR